MSQYEYEVKILEIDTESIKNRLHSLGVREIFNGHIVADFFRNSNGKKIRLRKMAGNNVLTYKIAYSTNTVLQNEEIEVVFDNYEGMVQVLPTTNFFPKPCLNNNVFPSGLRISVSNSISLIVSLMRLIGEKVL